MIVYANKDLVTNLIKFSKEENYLINKQNNIVYSSFEKGISIEYVVDRFFGKDINGIFIYEHLESDEIVIVYINKVNKSILFNIKNDFSTKKLENFIKLISFQDDVFNIYFFENSKIYGNLKLPDYILASFVERARFKKVFKGTPKLKNNQNKLVSLIVFFVITFGCSYGLDKLFNYLTIKSETTYQNKTALLIDKKFILEDEINKYDSLTQNLKEIFVVKNIEEYKKIKKEQEEILNNGGEIR